MSLKNTKEQLIQLHGQADNCVIALSGKWGTGKTHLWNEVKAGSGDDKVKNPLYVSLFGLSSIDQVKRKLIETAIPGVESHGGLFDGLNGALSAIRANIEAMTAEDLESFFSALGTTLRVLTTVFASLFRGIVQGVGDVGNVLGPVTTMIGELAGQTESDAGANVAHGNRQDCSDLASRGLIDPSASP